MRPPSEYTMSYEDKNSVHVLTQLREVVYSKTRKFILPSLDSLPQTTVRMMEVYGLLPDIPAPLRRWISSSSGELTVNQAGAYCYHVTSNFERNDAHVIESLKLLSKCAGRNITLDELSYSEGLNSSIVVVPYLYSLDQLNSLISDILREMILASEELPNLPPLLDLYHPVLVELLTMVKDDNISDSLIHPDIVEISLKVLTSISSRLDNLLEAIIRNRIKNAPSYDTSSLYDVLDSSNDVLDELIDKTLSNKG